MERKETIVNDELKDLLEQIKVADINIVRMVEESEEAQKLFDKETMLRQKLVDKMKPIVTELYKDKLSEFETLASTSLTEEGEVEVKILDELEMWKDLKRTKQKVKEATPSEPQKVDEVEKVDEILAETAE